MERGKKRAQAEPEVEAESEESQSGSDAEEQKGKNVGIYKREKIAERIKRIQKVTLKILNKFSPKPVKKVPWTEQLAVGITA